MGLVGQVGLVGSYPTYLTHPTNLTHPTYHNPTCPFTESINFCGS